MSKSPIFDHAMDFIDEHIEQGKNDIKDGLYAKFRHSDMRFSSFISILTQGQMSLDSYIIKRKLYFAALELENNPEISITDVGTKYYSESSSFSRAIKNEYGCTPSDIRTKKPAIIDNRLSLEQGTAPDSFLSKILDILDKNELYRMGGIETDYFMTYIHATEEYGFDTETCCLISDLSQRLKIPFAFLLDKCFDMAINMEQAEEDGFFCEGETEAVILLGIKSSEDYDKIRDYYGVQHVLELNREMVEQYYSDLEN